MSNLCKFAKKMKAFYLHGERELGDAVACEWIIWWYAGMIEDEVYDLFKRSYEAYEDADAERVTWTSPEAMSAPTGFAAPC